MTGISTPSLWTSVRDDDSDAYQIIDPSERLIASVPIGATKGDMARQHFVRDLVLAAPTLLATAKQVLVVLNTEEPDLDLCRALLGQAISAARGQ